MNNGIKHPLDIGTKVQYLSPRCPCSGKRYELMEGSVKQIFKNGSNYRYRIRAESKVIPSEAIIKLL